MICKDGSTFPVLLNATAVRDESDNYLMSRSTAEGVETEEQLSFLQEQKSDELQGYLFSKPVPPEEIPAILTRNCL